MSRWSPQRLPRMRRDLVMATRSAYAELPTDALPDEARAESGRLVNRLLAAELFWVTAEMADVAVRASVSLPEWTPSEAMPSRHGLLVWDRPIATVSWSGAPERGFTRSPLGALTAPMVRVWGAAWWPNADDPARPGIGLLARSAELGDLLADRWARCDLMMFSAVALPPADILRGGDYTGEGTETVRTLASTWLMMQQPTVASRSSLEGRPVGDGAAAPARPDRDVTIIDLRRLRQPGHERDPEAASGRMYTRRWVVSGHWRQQVCGPGRAHRKPIFVSPYVKGPDGAPLIESERVNVWRR